MNSSTAERDTLRDYATRDESMAAQKAKNVLDFFYGERIETQPEIPGRQPALLRRSNGNQTSVEENLTTYIKAFPNPAKDWVVVEYQLPSLDATGEILLTGIYGQEVLRMKVSGSKNQAVIETGSWPAGTYLYRLLCDEKPIGSGRFVVIK